MNHRRTSLRRLGSLALAFASLAAACDDESPADDVGVVDAPVADATAGDTTGDPDAGPTDDAPDAVPVDAADTADTAPEDVEIDLGPPPERAAAPENDGVYGFASGCYTVEAWTTYSPEHRLVAVADTAFAFTDDPDDTPAVFTLRAADLGTYLFYDAERRFLLADEGITAFGRVQTLDSDYSLLDDTFVSPAEWLVEVSPEDPTRFRLSHNRSGTYLGLGGLVAEAEDAAVVTFHEAEGCAEFPELAIDATGTVEPRSWEDGDLYGIAELHTHLLTNFGFGGGGMFHGSPFHRLGVEHALGTCSGQHGDGGRSDLIGYFYDGDVVFDVLALLPVITTGVLEDFQHNTDGYPTFTDWPNAWASSTHQTTYYRWVERAYLGGLRLMVQHATGNSVLCDLFTGIGSHETRYSCNDMVSVDRTLEEVRAMERYIDAQAGGPGEGWFRIVESPAEAREVIESGRLAVVLGIEISNVFDCFLTPPDGFEPCTEESVIEKLDHYYDLGIRVLFPNHKFDNAFSAGDGSGGIIELGNVVNSGHYTNMVEDCPFGRMGYDSGPITFGDLNRPREDYDAEPPLDMSRFAVGPLAALLPIAEDLGGEEPGNWCQNAGLTPLGEFLIEEMMKRGMIPELAHLPQRSIVRALEMLEEAGYPATSTHRQTYGGALYELGGMSPVNFGGCASGEPGSIASGILNRTAERAAAGAYPSEGLAFDLNGFAGGRRPRFGERSGCSNQSNPVEYPFTSYDGAITFTEPTLGERSVDFNTEGFLHIGLLPELLEDARLDGATDEDLEPLFRSAEAYVRMWEQAEARAAVLRGEE